MVRRCLEDDRIAEVRAVTRRATGLTGDKLREIRCEDFADLTSIAETFTGVDACFFCLGIAWGQAGGEDRYREITVTYPLAAARMLKARSPESTFLYLSGGGAGARSWWAWARIKAEAETQLASLGLRRAITFRPGYIHPDAGDEKSGAMGLKLYPILRTVVPSAVITAADLGRAMIEAVVGDVPDGILENREIRALAKREARS
ncbi:Oxidoreductase [Minicystis rosea]|nr:Oxidoreductase [Minicystis rosea]